jgi:hypothetical protein
MFNKVYLDNFFPHNLQETLKGPKLNKFKNTEQQS